MFTFVMSIPIMGPIAALVVKVCYKTKIKAFMIMIRTVFLINTVKPDTMY